MLFHLKIYDCMFVVLSKDLFFILRSKMFFFTRGHISDSSSNYIFINLTTHLNHVLSSKQNFHLFY